MNLSQKHNGDHTYLVVAHEDEWIAFLPRGYKICSVSAEEATKILLPVNGIFADFSSNEIALMMQFYTSIKERIRVIDMDAIKEVTSVLQGEFAELVEHLNLVVRMYEYARAAYPKSFYQSREAENEHRVSISTEMGLDFVVISMLSKMMMPIWGHIMEKRPSYWATDMAALEACQLNIILPLLTNSRLRPAVEKLSQIVYEYGASIWKIDGRFIDSSEISHGCTMVFRHLLLRSITSIYPAVEESNIITMLIMRIKRLHEGQLRVHNIKQSGANKDLHRLLVS